MPIRLFVLPDNSRKFFCPRFWSKNCSGKRAILHKSLVSLSYFFDACVRNVTSYCTSRLKLLQIKLVVFMETFQISSTTRIVHKFVFNNISGSLQTTELTWFRRKLFQICRCWSICKSLDHLFNFQHRFRKSKSFLWTFDSLWRYISTNLIKTRLHRFVKEVLIRHCRDEFPDRTTVTFIKFDIIPMLTVIMEIVKIVISLE